MAIYNYLAGADDVAPVATQCGQYSGGALMLAYIDADSNDNTAALQALTPGMEFQVRDGSGTVVWDATITSATDQGSYINLNIDATIVAYAEFTLGNPYVVEVPYVGPSAPAAPTGVAATNGTATDKVTVTWTDSSDACTYEVYRSTSSDGSSPTKVSGGTDIAAAVQTFDDTSAPIGVPLWYAVKAIDTGGSTMSSWVMGWRAGGSGGGLTTDEHNALMAIAAVAPAYTPLIDSNGYVTFNNSVIPSGWIGTGSGQLSITSGVVAASGNWNTTTPPTVQAIVDGISATVPSGKTNAFGARIPDAVAGSASGLAIVGSAMGITAGAIVTASFGTCVLPETTKTAYLPAYAAGAASGLPTLDSSTHLLVYSVNQAVTLPSTIPSGWIGTGTGQISVSAGVVAASGNWNTTVPDNAVIGNIYAIVNHTDYGNAKLVRSTTPANTLSVDSNHLVAVPDTQKVDLNTVKTQTLTCGAAVTIGAYVGNATHAIIVDANGYVTYNNAAPPALTGIALTTDVTTAASNLETYMAGTGVKASSVTDKTGYALTSAYDAAKSAAPAGAKMDLIDAPNSTALAAAATAVWAAGTRTLSSFGTLVADIATAVWGAATRTLSAFGFNVTVGGYASGQDPRTLIEASGSKLDALYAIRPGHTLAVDSSGYVTFNNTSIGTVTTLTNLPAITTDWLTAAGVKADAVTKIQSGLATPTNITSASGIVLASSQHVIVDSGTVTTLTNLPAITAGWLTATGIASGALNGKGDWSTATALAALNNLSSAAAQAACAAALAAYGVALEGAGSNTLASLSAQITGLPYSIGNGALTGTMTVTDSNGNPLAGALVNARLSGTIVASGVTNVSGQITNWVFAANTYSLAVMLPGYLPNTGTLTVSANGWAKTISLTQINITPPASPELCTVQFRVMLSDTPVVGATCQASLIGINQATDGTVLSNAVLSATTDSTGVAELQLVRRDDIVKGDGRYELTVTSNGQTVSAIKTTIPNQSTILYEILLP